MLKPWNGAQTVEGNRHQSALVLMCSLFSISASRSCPGQVTDDYKRDALAGLRIFLNFLDFFPLSFPMHNFKKRRGRRRPLSEVRYANKIDLKAVKIRTGQVSILLSSHFHVEPVITHSGFPRSQHSYQNQLEIKENGCCQLPIGQTEQHSQGQGLTQMIQHTLAASQKTNSETPNFQGLISPPSKKEFIGSHENLCKRTTNISLKRKCPRGPSLSFSRDSCMLNLDVRCKHYRLWGPVPTHMPTQHRVTKGEVLVLPCLATDHHTALAPGESQKLRPVPRKRCGGKRGRP